MIEMCLKCGGAIVDATDETHHIAYRATSCAPGAETIRIGAMHFAGQCLVDQPQDSDLIPDFILSRGEVVVLLIVLEDLPLHTEAEEALLKRLKAAMRRPT